jgi:hypothetical protein
MRKACLLRHRLRRYRGSLRLLLMLVGNVMTIVAIAAARQQRRRLVSLLFQHRQLPRPTIRPRQSASCWAACCSGIRSFQARKMSPARRAIIQSSVIPTVFRSVQMALGSVPRERSSPATSHDR